MFSSLTVFQSLFYWILFLRPVASQRAATGEDKFQSLFYWILFLRKNREKHRGKSGGVSILVLLDFVLKEGGRFSYVEFDGSFNPCFIGFCS